MLFEQWWRICKRECCCTRERITVQISRTLLQSMKYTRKEWRALLIWSQAAAGHCGLCNAGCTNMVPRASIESEIHTLWDGMSVRLHTHRLGKNSRRFPEKFLFLITSRVTQFFSSGFTEIKTHYSLGFGHIKLRYRRLNYKYLLENYLSLIKHKIIKNSNWQWNYIKILSFY